MENLTTPEKAHAKLSASGAHRWMNCPGSVRLEEQFPDVTSDYAEEGTLAHEFVELRLKKELVEPRITARKYNAELKKLQAKKFYSPEMIRHAENYVDKITELFDSVKNAACYSEQKVKLDSWIPGSFGTCDTIIAASSKLIIVDFKYGQGVPVSAENNPQLMLYALGALDYYDLMYGFDIIKMVIIQPRLENGYSEFTMTRNALLDFGEKVKEAAKATEKPDAELKCGEWCRFCKARNQCRARVEEAFSVETMPHVGTSPELLSSKEIGEYLAKGKILKAWLDDVAKYAEKELLSGNSIEGWKLVEGRTTRQWTNEEDAFGEIIAEGLAQEVMLYERKPLTLAQVEKLLTKPVFEKYLLKYVTRSAGKPTMVEESDKRPAISTAITADEAFSGPLPEESDTNQAN